MKQQSVKGHENGLATGQGNQTIQKVLDDILSATRNVQKSVVLFEIKQKGDLSETDASLNLYLLLRTLHVQACELSAGLKSLERLQHQSPELVHPEDLAKLLGIDLNLLNEAKQV